MEKPRELRKFISTELQALMEAIKGRDIGELRIEKGSFSITIKQGCPAEYEPRSQESAQGEDHVPDEEPISVTANMVGIFHRASTPFETPLIEAGKDVSTGQIIGYIESMRLMHELRSPCSGRVIRIAAEENEPVDFGRLILEVTAT